MKVAWVSLLAATIISWSPMPAALAQEAPPAGEDSADNSPAEGADDMHTRSLFDYRNYMIRTDAGDGVGYLRGYQTFAAFQPVTVTEDELVFWVSPRGYVTFNSGSFGGNLGTGARWLDWDHHRIYGGGVWWDHDNNGLNQYNQFGASFESLGQFLDFRANAYYPTSQTPNVISQTLNPAVVTFLGNNIGIGRETLFNSALRGGDFEIGGAFPGIVNSALRAYAGGYYYQGPLSGGGAYGARGRLELLYTRNVWGNVMVTHDRLFGTNVIGGATIYLGSGMASRDLLAPMPLPLRLYQQMERQYRVAVQRDVENDIVLALRAGGTGGSGGPVGTPIVVDHVNNAAAPGGDGSVEHPFNHLPTTTPGNVDIIFVQRGDGTSNNLNTGITLNNFQRLLGDGVQHSFTALQGTFVLPGFTAGALPTLTNPAGSAVTLASHNEVSGFNITSASAHGITGAGITDFNINNVNVTKSGVDGLFLTDATGAGRIASSKFNSNTGDGVSINNSTGGTLGLTMTGDAADKNTADGIAIVLAAGATLNARVTGVEASNNNNPFFGAGVGNGFVLNASGSTANLTMSKDTFSSNGLNGLNFSLTNASTLIGTFDQITASSNNNPVVAAGAGNGFGYNSDNSTGNVTITHSTFSTNGLDGLSFTTANGSTLITNVLNNTTSINSNLQDGVLFTNTDSQVNATLQNNVISSNGSFGINVISDGTGAHTSLFDLSVGGLLAHQGNTLSSNHGAGIADLLENQATGNVTILGNTIQSTVAASLPYVGQGIDIRLTGTLASANAALGTALIDGNTIGSLTTASLGNAGGGIVVFADQNTSIGSLTIGNVGTTHTGNVIGHNGGDGVNISNGDTAQIGTASPVLIGDNQIGTNTGNGIAITAANTTAVAATYDVTNNAITGNTINGLLLSNNSLTTATQTINLNATGNSFMTNGQMGVQVQDTNGITNLTVGDAVNPAMANSFSQNHGAGIGYFTTGTPNSFGTHSVINIFDNVISQTAAGTIPVVPGDGIDINLASDGTSVNPRNVDLQIGMNTITGNASDGIHLEVHNLVTLSPTQSIFGNTITNNGGSGINILSTDGASATIGLSANAITGSGGDGVKLTTNGTSLMNVSINSVGGASTIDGNTGNGINVTTNSSANFMLNVSNTEISNNRLDGYLASHTGGNVNVTLTDDAFTHNLQRGVDVSFTNNAGTFDPSATGTGYVIQGTNTTLPNTLSQITNNGAGGIFLQTAGNGTAVSPVNTVVFVVTNSAIESNTPVSGPATPNMDLTVGTGSLVWADVQNNTFLGNATDFVTSSLVNVGPAQAQLNLRFLSNTGTLVNPGGGTGQLFQVEDTYSGGTHSALNDTNFFTNNNPPFSGTNTVQQAFSPAGGFTLVNSPTFTTPPLPTYTGPGP